MNSIFTLFTTYLIYPILAFVLIGVAALIGKKNNLLRNKRLVVYTLLSILLFTAPALLGFLNYDFMPYVYLILACAYFILGWYNNRLLPWVFDKQDLKYGAKSATPCFSWYCLCCFLPLCSIYATNCNTVCGLPQACSPFYLFPCLYTPITSFYTSPYWCTKRGTTMPPRATLPPKSSTTRS